MIKNNKGNLFRALLLSLCLLPVAASASTFSGMYVFGDSLSDNGNLYAATSSLLGSGVPAAPYYNGRFSNGPVAAEDIANSMIVGGSTGSDFHDLAYGGATSGIGNYSDYGTPGGSGLFGLPGLTREVSNYTSGAGIADPNALYMVWAGPNDYVAGSIDYALAASNVSSAVQSLLDIGARNILVPNMPDLSKTPDYFGDTGAQDFAVGFNNLLSADLYGLNTGGANVTQFDTFGLFNNVLADPSAYGFSNVTDPCYTGGYFGMSSSDTICSNPDSYLFWDHFHPTAAGHQLLADAMAASLAPSPVPVPASLLLMMSGLIGLIGLGKRRSK